MFLQEQNDSEDFLAREFGGDVDEWSDVARNIASILLCEESLSVWL